MNARLVVGLDFGTDTVRTVVVDSADGREISQAVTEYPRWREGKYCDPVANRFRQHPLDFIEGLETSVREALAKATKGIAERIVGIGIDTTGSTPCAVDREGIPLALTRGFEDNPNAMFVLWKDHTAVEEAGEINTVSRTWGGEDFTLYSGGVYSSEWFWSKILHVLREDKAVARAAFSWVEHCDWMPALLTGRTDPISMIRSRCAAGHKAMWHASWNGLPSQIFLDKLDKRLTGIRERLYIETITADRSAGTLSLEWARRLGLPMTVHVAAGAFDAHLGAVGAEIEPYHLSKVMGTSTCDMLIAPLADMEGKLVRGICGQVDGSILPGMVGMEAGQSSFGDVYAWFRDLLLYPLRSALPAGIRLEGGRDPLDTIFHVLIPNLSGEAEKLPIDEKGITALDWFNGRRTPDADQRLKGALAGLSLGSDAPRIFRSLVEATAFGAKKIVDRFISEGVPIRGVIGLGGVAKKNPFIMQVMSDVLNMPMRIVRSEQAVALGSAMAAATAAGIYPRLEAAQKAMGSGFEKTYHPDRKRAGQYRALYEKYEKLGRFMESVRE